jgi:hypothetical protein
MHASLSSGKGKALSFLVEHSCYTSSLAALPRQLLDKPFPTTAN